MGGQTVKEAEFVFTLKKDTKQVFVNTTKAFEIWSFYKLQKVYSYVVLVASLLCKLVRRAESVGVQVNPYCPTVRRKYRSCRFKA